VKGGRRVVGVVDDDASVRGALLRLFRTSGLEVSLFGAAEEYLAYPDRTEIDCLVIDVRLPGMGGLELLEQVQAESPRPALVITAHEDERARTRAGAAGAIGFFLKPFDNRELVAAVDRALGITGRETGSHP
jgi:FixJ family two-component response regulator